MIKFIEATNGSNWGKFMVRSFGVQDWLYRSTIGDTDEAKAPMLLRYCGWGPEHHLVLDLQTGEGAIFAIRPGGNPHADLDKHRIWVCPMFEPFLAWLYQQNMDDLTKLPALVELDDPFEWRGYRRPGPEPGVEYAPDYKYTIENPEPGPEAVGQPPMK